jgi:hypothetical protein
VGLKIGRSENKEAADKKGRGVAREFYSCPSYRSLNAVVAHLKNCPFGVVPLLYRKWLSINNFICKGS